MAVPAAGDAAVPDSASPGQNGDVTALTRRTTALRTFRRHLRAGLSAVGRGLVLLFAWVVVALPVATWLGATVALAHAMERSGIPGDAGPLPEFAEGWRRHWRVAVPLGTVSLLVLVALVANLLFLSGRDGVLAFTLLVGTLVLLVLWGMVMLSLIATLVLLADLPRRDALTIGLLLAFRHPVSTGGLLLVTVLLVTMLSMVWVPLTVLAVPVVARMSLGLTRRHLASMG